MVLLTINILLGLLLSTNYNPVRRWPRRRVPIFEIHNWTAYIALGLVCLHPILLLSSSTAGFQIGHVLLPINSPGQRLYNNLGAITFYLVTFVVITSYFRDRLSNKTWKRFHYVAYAAAAFLYTHGLLIDPNLKNLPPDLLDGEKVVIEVCFLTVLACSLWRLQYGRQKRTRRASRQLVTKS